MTKIKICGITNLNDALLAARLGADALGFIFTASPRQISPERAKEITSELPPYIHKVGVFKNERISTVKEIIEHCLLDLVQLHGEEDKSYLNEFGQRAIKVFKMNKKSVLSEIKKFSLPLFMLDLPKGEAKEMNLDWTIAQEAKNLGKVILAGGLSPENIKRALQIITPFGVDVCRGVEREDGVKSREKLKNFILKVRKWDIQKT
jgi:phosphoribosylanthranilate isomerase